MAVIMWIFVFAITLIQWLLVFTMPSSVSIFGVPFWLMLVLGTSWIIFRFESVVFLARDFITRDKIEENRGHSPRIVYSDEDIYEFNHTSWHKRRDILWRGNEEILISYIDRFGVFTSRDIIIYGVMPNIYGKLIVRAWCRKRDDWRTFYIERICSVVTKEQVEYSDFSEYMRFELKIDQLGGNYSAT
ncbi:TPA: hypothetical protein I7172_21850 [Vibrio vulnificus]|nr:hypothetical protein [Vibrio vulnificus]